MNFPQKTGPKNGVMSVSVWKATYNSKKLNSLITVNISLGYATKSRIGQNTDKIIKMADKDMYKNKNNKKMNIPT